ncbi:MAG TPA: thioesterase family protein [Acidimicrobiales bacterium]|jgi:acyl-CoA thioester hydrolase|nr:thioesterase family protein [Acidimicrobiales bacterium]MDP7352402.1 thioesterase family protein [Acidimicrobiales bacterium]MDP7507470.1 thioesterase family protein [Acidimicrobiales bacterium]HJM31770.1 thioesterase family protein [Acidimicrobiales bacterium]HJO20095.1 thioesterase family protein [Acidimicrobiales bacterium]|tara:strand:- start:2791 stop:3213 length:423 start_codon:yes stop_codon:yes gene_type:complete
MPECHRHPVKVRFYELDPYGHLNHSVYVQLFETGRIELLDSVGLGLLDLEDRGYRLIVSRIETRFLASAIGGDSLVIETEVVQNRRASSRWGQRIVRDDEVLATQEVLVAITDTNGRPVRIPALISDALAPYAVEESDAG